MKIISTTEFRKQLSKYLGMAHNETVFISRKGKHMVMIIPVPDSDVNTIIAKNNEDQRFTVTKKVR